MTSQGGWAVILGCSSGVGRAISAQVAHTPGLNIFGAHRGNHIDEANALAADVEAAGRRAVFHLGDVGTWDGAAQAADELLEIAGPKSVRLFVHSIANASLGRFMPGGEGPRYRQFVEKNYSKTMNAMANSFPWWAQALVARDLLADGAQLLGLTNPIVDSLVHNFGLITAAKAALEMYVKHLALEMGPMGHRVNLLNFGTVETRAAAIGFGEEWDRFKALCTGAIGAGRLVSAEEVARFVTVLCSPEANWFNGATIDFTGGQARNLLDAAIYRPPGGRDD